MNKYSLFSFVLFCIYFVLFSLLVSGVSFGGAGKAVIILTILIPFAGTILGFMGKKGILKWTSISLNLIAFCIILFFIILGFGMGER